MDLPMSTDKILLDQGSGGKASHSLIADLLVPEFDNPILAELNDSAVLDIEGKRLAFSTDTYVVDPIFFRVETSDTLPSTAR